MRINYGITWLFLVLAGIISLGFGIQGCVIWEEVKIQDQSGGSGDLLAPSAAKATPITSIRIDVGWTDNANNESGFRVERSDDGGISYSQIGQTGENEANYYDESISVVGTYYYRVCAFNRSGNSLYAGPVSATNTAPVAPSGLTGTAKSYTQIDLAWIYTRTNETGFKVERSTDGTNFTLLKAILTDDPAYRASPTAITCTYSDASLLPTTAYTYQVRSYSTNLGDSSPSNKVTVTTLSVTDLVKTWGGSSNERLNKILVGSDANIYAAGYTNSFGAGTKDALLLKYDSAGKILFAKSWGQTSEDEATGLAMDNDKNIYISGRTSNFASREGAIFLNKYNAIGQLQFQRIWDGNNSETASSLARTTSGLYVCGETRSYGIGETDMLTLKYSAEGALLWARTWGTTAADVAYGIAADGSDNVYLVGESNAISSADIAVISLNSSGNLRWQRIWRDNNNERARAVAVSASGDVFVGGETDSSGAGSYDVVILRYNSSGGLIWSRRWGGYKDDIPYAIRADTATGNIYVVGTTESFYTSKSVFLIAYNSSGDIQSQQVWDGNLDDEGFQVTADQYCVFICGYTRNKADEGVWTNVSGTAGLTFPYATSPTPGGSQTTPSALLAGPITSAVDGSPTGVETGAGQDDALLLRTKK